MRHTVEIQADGPNILVKHILHEGFFPDDLLRPAQFGEDVCLIGAALHSKRMLEQAWNLNEGT